MSWREELASPSWREELASAVRKGVRSLGARRPGPRERTELRFSDIAAVMGGEILAPPLVVPNLLMEQGIHSFTGHPGHGKTTIAMWSAFELMKQGWHVVWLDFEIGLERTAGRLQAIGVSADLAAEQLHYSGYPVIEPTPAGREAMLGATEGYENALVVVDSLGHALAAAGLNENSNEDASLWATEVIFPLREAGATVVLVDHPNKNGGQWASGAGAKLRGIDSQKNFKRLRKFSREQAGSVEVAEFKDREGVFPAKVIYEVGDGEGNLPVEEIDVILAEEDGDLEDHARNRVRATLAEHAISGAEVTSNQVVSLTTGRRQEILTALRDLQADESEPVVGRIDGKSTLYRFDPEAASPEGPPV